MNNFVFSQDPLLYTQPQSPMYPQQDQDIKKQLDVIMAQYQMLQQKPPTPTTSNDAVEDHLGGLDNMMKQLDPSVLETLNSDVEFMQINAWIQSTIQSELMRDVKNRMNGMTEVIQKVTRAKEIINNVKSVKEAEDRKNIMELNDYVQNYSDMTFKEYKQLKQLKQNT